MLYHCWFESKILENFSTEILLKLRHFQGIPPKFLEPGDSFLSKFVGGHFDGSWSGRPWPKWLKQPRFPSRNTELTPTSLKEGLDSFSRQDIFRLTLVGEPRPWLERFWTEISLEGAAVLGLLLLSPCGWNNFWSSNSAFVIVIYFIGNPNLRTLSQKRSVSISKKSEMFQLF